MDGKTDYRGSGSERGIEYKEADRVVFLGDETFLCLDWLLVVVIKPHLIKTHRCEHKRVNLTAYKFKEQ